MTESIEQELYKDTTGMWRFCGERNENQAHILQCKSEKQEIVQTDLLQVLDDDLTTEKTHPDIVMLMVLAAKGENIGRLTVEEENKELRILIEEQTEIGQYNHLLGFWSQQWKKYQKQYTPEQG